MNCHRASKVDEDERHTANEVCAIDIIQKVRVVDRQTLYHVDSQLSRAGPGTGELGSPRDMEALSVRYWDLNGDPRKHPLIYTAYCSVYVTGGACCSVGLHRMSWQPVQKRPSLRILLGV
jgi:hypothetical protein